VNCVNSVLFKGANGLRPSENITFNGSIGSSNGFKQSPEGASGKLNDNVYKNNTMQNDIRPIENNTLRSMEDQYNDTNLNDGEEELPNTSVNREGLIEHLIKIFTDSSKKAREQSVLSMDLSARIEDIKDELKDTSIDKTKAEQLNNELTALKKEVYQFVSFPLFHNKIRSGINSLDREIKATEDLVLKKKLQLNQNLFQEAFLYLANHPEENILITLAKLECVIGKKTSFTEMTGNFGVSFSKKDIDEMEEKMILEERINLQSGTPYREILQRTLDGIVHTWANKYQFRGCVGKIFEEYFSYFDNQSNYPLLMGKTTLKVNDKLGSELGFKKLPEEIVHLKSNKKIKFYSPFDPEIMNDLLELWAIEFNDGKNPLSHCLATLMFKKLFHDPTYYNNFIDLFNGNEIEFKKVVESNKNKNKTDFELKKVKYKKLTILFDKIQNLSKDLINAKNRNEITKTVTEIEKAFQTAGIPVSKQYFPQILPIVLLFDHKKLKDLFRLDASKLDIQAFVDIAKAFSLVPAVSKYVPGMSLILWVLCDQEESPSEIARFISSLSLAQFNLNQIKDSEKTPFLVVISDIVKAFVSSNTFEFKSINTEENDLFNQISLIFEDPKFPKLAETLRGSIKIKDNPQFQQFAIKFGKTTGLTREDVKEFLLAYNKGSAGKGKFTLPYSFSNSITLEIIEELKGLGIIDKNKFNEPNYEFKPQTVIPGLTAMWNLLAEKTFNNAIDDLVASYFPGKDNFEKISLFPRNIKLLFLTLNGPGGLEKKMNGYRNPYASDVVKKILPKFKELIGYNPNSSLPHFALTILRMNLKKIAEDLLSIPLVGLSKDGRLHYDFDLNEEQFDNLFGIFMIFGKENDDRIYLKRLDLQDGVFQSKDKDKKIEYNNSIIPIGLNRKNDTLDIPSNFFNAQLTTLNQIFSIKEINELLGYRTGLLSDTQKKAIKVFTKGELPIIVQRIVKSNLFVTEQTFGNETKVITEFVEKKKVVKFDPLREAELRDKTREEKSIEEMRQRYEEEERAARNFEMKLGLREEEGNKIFKNYKSNYGTVKDESEFNNNNQKSMTSNYNYPQAPNNYENKTNQFNNQQQISNQMMIKQNYDYSKTQNNYEKFNNPNKPMNNYNYPPESNNSGVTSKTNQSNEFIDFNNKYSMNNNSNNPKEKERTSTQDYFKNNKN